MSNNTISIALCTYNGEKYLREQLDSLACQTRLPDEVIVGDDGSSDSTVEILRQWSAEVPFSVKIFCNNQNIGFAKNFEQTMGRCTCDIIFPCDQDDIWHPEKLARMTEVFDKTTGVSIVYCFAEMIFQDGSSPKPIKQLVHDWHEFFQSAYLTPFWRQQPMDAGCCSAIARTCLKTLFPIPGGIFHDMWFYVLASHLGTVVTLDEMLIQYRRHGENASYSTNPAYRGWGSEGITNNFRAAPYLYQRYRDQIRLVTDKLMSLPASEMKQKHLVYLKSLCSHYENRLLIEESVWKYWYLLLFETLTLRYWQYHQPVKSVLYDIKTGLTSKPG